MGNSYWRNSHELPLNLQVRAYHTPARVVFPTDQETSSLFSNCQCVKTLHQSSGFVTLPPWFGTCRLPSHLSCATRQRAPEPLNDSGETMWWVVMWISVCRITMWPPGPLWMWSVGAEESSVTRTATAVQRRCVLLNRLSRWHAYFFSPPRRYNLTSKAGHWRSTTSSAWGVINFLKNKGMLIFHVVSFFVRICTIFKLHADLYYYYYYFGLRLQLMILITID